MNDTSQIYGGCDFRLEVSDDVFSDLCQYIDDLFVFFVAMTTLQMTGITTKYARWSHLIGGMLMLIIGLLLIFKPSWLMFG